MFSVPQNGSIQVSDTLSVAASDPASAVAGPTHLSTPSRPRLPLSRHDTPRRPTCKECRGRKVRCDRFGDRCGPCARFDLACSYSGSGQVSSTAAQGNVAVDSALGGISPGRTQAGLLRRRIRRACKACRALKVRCSGDIPCSRCRTHHQACAYHQDDIAEHHGGSGGIPSTTINPSPPVTHEGMAVMNYEHPRETASTHSNPPPVNPPLPLTRDMSRAQKDMEAFFDNSSESPVSIQFLHRPSVLADWSQGHLDSTLAATICALGRLATVDGPISDEENVGSEDEGVAEARAWLAEAQKAVVGKIGTITMAQLQTLILIIQYHISTRDVMEAWNMVSLAARLAFTLRLNYELPGWDHDPVMQETKRRMMWSIWVIDRLLAGGIEDLIVCPTERMRIRLPCDDYTFHRGVASRAEFLPEPTSPTESSDNGVLGYYLRLHECRHRILRYTKNVIRESASPASSADELNTLQAELAALQNSLPADLKLGPDRLRLKAHSPDAGDYIALHMLWNQCHCDLYRFLIPGIREAVSRDALEHTPIQYTARCQESCFRAALRAADLLADLYRLGFRKACGIPNLTVGIYQITQILYKLPHLVKSPTKEQLDAGGLKSTLRDAHRMVTIMQRRTRLRPKMAELLTKANSLIESMGHDIPPSHDGNGGVEEPVPSRPTPPSMWSASGQHLASRGSFLDDVEGQTASGDGAVSGDSIPGGTARTSNPSPENTSAPNRNGRTDRETWAGHGLLSLQQSLANTPVVVTGGTADVWDRFSAQRHTVENNIPWDPFEVQHSEYHDAELESALWSLSGNLAGT